MPSTPIRATDSIVIAAPVAVVYGALTDVRDYPRWWPRSLRVHVLTHNSEAVGSELELRPRCGRPFRCRIVSAEATSVRIRYDGGFIEGTGEWQLEPVAEGTKVGYHLDVRAHGLLVALLGRVLDLARLHSEPMRHVLRNLEWVALERARGPSAGPTER